ncbi:hypothetical protein PR202_gb23095 [Eleusine coracana subsp. coracana]|uniref:Uncharacterized protein n=1 Tax=Eleusine coracana subsp. coracana TaxID=191504 RepID=A0AAV5FIK4_ELECO|nr:hypothetical protein PR202_gb23095 [Eleusine coracana subsp. coracana]
MWLMMGLAHRKLAAAARRLRATRLMAFSLGETRMIVAAHPDVAREILGSPAFADRPIKETAYGLLFHRAIGFAPHGAYWRALRRVASTHLFSPWQVAASAPQRAVIARQMVSALVVSASAAGRGGDVVVVRQVLRRAALHNVMWSVFGRRYELEMEPARESPETRELRTLVDEGYDLLGKLNWSDHLPWLARFDLQGTRARCARLVPRVNRFVGGIIDEHRAKRNDDHPSAVVADFTDVLLSLEGDDRLAESDMIAVLWEMVFRGTDTVAALIEWVLARLVLHPQVQDRVHDELDRVVGPGRAVTESDASSLVYLHAVIKEVLRLHPPGPLLSWARLATSDVHVDGFLIPPATHHGQHVVHHARPRSVGRAQRVPPGPLHRLGGGGRQRDGVGPQARAVRVGPPELPREEPRHGHRRVLARHAAARVRPPAGARRRSLGGAQAVLRDGRAAGGDRQASQSDQVSDYSGEIDADGRLVGGGRAGVALVQAHHRSYAVLAYCDRYY